jgi:hypothetical protein
MLLVVAPFLTGGSISILPKLMSPLINALVSVIVGGGRALG